MGRIQINIPKGLLCTLIAGAGICAGAQEFIVNGDFENGVEPWVQYFSDPPRAFGFNVIANQFEGGKSLQQPRRAAEHWGPAQYVTEKIIQHSGSVQNPDKERSYTMSYWIKPDTQCETWPRMRIDDGGGISMQSFKKDLLAPGEKAGPHGGKLVPAGTWTFVSARHRIIWSGTMKTARAFPLVGHFPNIKIDSVGYVLDNFSLRPTSCESTPPKAPLSVSATAQNNGSVLVSWKDTLTNEDGFIIEKSLSASSGFAEVARIGANATQITIPDISADKDVYFRVKAFNPSGASAASNVAKVSSGSVALTAHRPSMIKPGALEIAVKEGGFEVSDAAGPGANHSITVYSMSGQEVVRATSALDNKFYRLPGPGLYLVTVKSRERTVHTKVLLSK